VGDEDETAGLPDYYQETAAKLHAFFKSRKSDGGYKLLERCAAHIFDSGRWEIDEWMDNWTYAPLLWEALEDLGYAEKATHAKTKSLFAA